MSSVAESCCCGASITLHDTGPVFIGYKADDFRNAHTVCRTPPATPERVDCEPGWLTRHARRRHRRPLIRRPTDASGRSGSSDSGAA